MEELCICGEPLDTALALWCQDCRDDERRRFAATAARNELLALRAKVVTLERERSEALARLNSARVIADHYRRAYYKRRNPDLFLIGGLPL